MTPISAQRKVLEDIEKQHSEISISRPSDRLSWGIPVPNDPSQTIYVWLDALTNYLTVLGYPNKGFEQANVTETIHIIGKDITKFHCVYYPLFLRAAGLPLPRKVMSHGHWLKDNFKMSKSLGNVTCPFQLFEEFGSHSVRTYMLAEGPQGKDSNFEKQNLKNLHNGFIADQYINLLNRVIGKKFMKKLPAVITYVATSSLSKFKEEVD